MTEQEIKQEMLMAILSAIDDDDTSGSLTDATLQLLNSAARHAQGLLNWQEYQSKISYAMQEAAKQFPQNFVPFTELRNVLNTVSHKLGDYNDQC